MQERIRTECGGTKISTMAAVMPQQKYAGAKVYTTIAGQFSFVIVLFSAEDGRPLASVEANAITRLRTAACSVLAARHLARAQVKRVGIYGAGVQGRAHAMQLSQAYALEEIRISDPFATPGIAAALQDECGVPVRLVQARDAVDGADIVVTASRSATPLFAGGDIPQGCFVAAIGSSLPHTRELDDIALARASRIAVDWGPQTLREAGDLVQADSASGVPGKLVELADLLAGCAPGRTRDDEITIYKAVGVALQDIALAGLAYERMS
jgi:ornithine cyclodeaminase